MPKPRRSYYRPQPFTVDYYGKAGQFLMSEEIIARHHEEALMVAGGRVRAYGASTCRLFDEDIAARGVTDDLHRALRAMSGGRVPAAPGSP